MFLNEYMIEKGLTKYRLSQLSGVPYATLSDICSGKTPVLKCSVETIYQIATALEISMDELVKPYIEPRPSFELFKSEVCHRLKDLGDSKFLIETLEGDFIINYYKKKWYPECFYLLAMVDYVSKENNLPVCEEYDSLRERKLKKLLYPSSILAMSAAAHNEDAKKEALKNALPEFLKYNIVENEVRNVI